MRALFIAGALLALTLASHAAAASGDPYLDQANTVPCPSAPQGWFNPPGDGGRSVLTPLTVLTAPDGLTTYFAAPVIEIDCVYRTDSGKSLDVSVRYALPTDLNPWNDFYIGCTSTHRQQAPSTAAEAWNTTQRVYRVVGAKSWSLATFIDNLKQLEPGDVPRFETMADTMLSAVQQYAHNCSLAGKGAAVAVKSLWAFGFDVHVTSGGEASSAASSGSFFTSAGASGGPTGTISDLTASNFRVRVTAHGHAATLTIHVGAPIAFSHSYGAALRTQVAVLASTLEGCRRGARGTLAISVPFLTSPVVTLSVCGHTYLNGAGSVRATIKSV